MLAWLRSPRGSAATATAVAAVLALMWLAPWPSRHALAPPAATPDKTAALPLAAVSPSGTSSPSSGVSPAAPKPTSSGDKMAALGTPVPSDNPAAPLSNTSAASLPLPGAELSARGEATADPKVPAFDIVRVEPTGDTVVAGRAVPGSDVALLDDGKVVAHMTVDGTGQFAMLPPALGEGSHFLTLQTTVGADAPVASLQSVAVAVSKGGTNKPMIAMMSPDQPVRVLSDGAPVAPANATGAGAQPQTSSVAIQSVEAGQGGQFTASGVARAGSQCRLYLNGAFLADVTAGADGRWSLKVAKGMKPGRYTVRADQLEGASGKVINRAEVPFDYPALAAIGHGKRLLLAKAATVPPSLASVQSSAAPGSASFAKAPSAQPAPVKRLASAGAAPLASNTDAGGIATDPAAAVVQQLQTATVIRGDSLWRISRKMLGFGVKYTEIYASNATQIRNPSLIYPGQIFVVPNKSIN